MTLGSRCEVHCMNDKLACTEFNGLNPHGNQNSSLTPAGVY